MLWAVAGLAAAGGASAPAGWVDGLAGRQGERAVAGGGECRLVGGVLEARGTAGEGWTRVDLAHAPAASYEMELDLQWRPMAGRPGGDGFEIALGPHTFGSAGYRIVAQQEPWRVAECPGPKLAPGAWHALRIQVRAQSVAYCLGDRQVALSPAVRAPAQDVTLRVGPGAQAAVRRCRLRALGDGEGGAAGFTGARFAYAGADFGLRGGVVGDPAAAGGRAAEVAGAPLGRPLLWGQDATLPAQGAYVALFGLRGIDGSGPVRLEAAPSGGAAVATRVVRLEELPRDAYEAVAVPFHYAGSGPMEYRIRADRGRLRVDQVAVVEESDFRSRPAGEAAARPRRALPLAQAWGKAPQGAAAAASGFSVLRLSRQWHEDGWFEFTVGWRLGTREPVSQVAIDLWVACRDAGGGVTTFDLGVAYPRVEPGEHQVTAWLDPASCRQVGGPVALFAQIYRDGVPVAAGWRKWGIPVDDRYIVEARRAGSLRATRPQ